MTVTELRIALGGKGDLQVVYDGQCPFCTQYVKLMQLRKAVGSVDLIDARSPGVQAKIKTALDLNLNDGMMALYGNRYYYGADAIHFLATMTSKSNAWNKAMAIFFQNQTIAGVLYPVLKLGRRGALFLLGRKPITDASS